MVLLNKIFTFAFVVFMIMVNIVLPVSASGPPDNIDLTKDPYASQIIGTPTTMIANVTDISGNPVDDGTVILFETNFGIFDESGTDATYQPTTNGIATAHINSSASGTAWVYAYDANNSSISSMDYVDFEIYSIDFKIEPEQPLETSTSTIFTTIQDQYGSPVSGWDVEFTSSYFAYFFWCHKFFEIIGTGVLRLGKLAIQTIKRARFFM